MRQFHEIALIKQPELQRLSFDKRADLTALKCSDPTKSLDLAQLLDRLMRDHAPISYQHHMLEAKLLTQLLDLRHQRLGIPSVAFIHRDRHWTARLIGQQAVVDLELVLLPVAVMADLGQGTVRTLEVAGREIVKRQRAFL